MARLLLFALCVLPSVVSAWSMGNPFHVQGRVYCDTCQCGFETIKTAYIPGATVRIECRDRTDLQLRYSLEGVTDSNGAYKIKVVGDQADRICQVVLVDSPLADCKSVDPVRNRAEIILTRSNGAISDLHYANSLGFVKDKALPGCAELVKKLLESDA
uniref:Pollen-specific protein C13 n=1 Tax=Salix viminalis TaxID=40686 RepID=A0A6N2LXH6_SALVM